MNKNKVYEFNNLDKRFSFYHAEDQNTKTILAQEKGVLTLSYKYDKNKNQIIELGGTLGERMKENLTPDLFNERVQEYVGFVSEYYDPNSRTNQRYREVAIQETIDKLNEEVKNNKI